MLYAMLLALFLPLGLLFNHFDQQQRNFEEGERQSSLFYADQLRQLLPRCRKEGDDKLREVKWKELSPLLSSGFELKERKDIKQYVDGQGFYLVWKKPKPGLANSLVKHYSRSGGQGVHLIFYHIGFAEKRGSDICLQPSRHYQYPDLSKVTCAWPLPTVISEGALILTDREPKT
ncbi:MAG: hypothetical protein AB2992_06200 [Candidatus Symbiodolus clandestinus]